MNDTFRGSIFEIGLRGSSAVNRLMKTVLVMLLVPGLFACAANRGGEGSVMPARAVAEREIRHIEQVEWPRALKLGDVAWFQRHLADELVVTTGRTGLVTNKTQEIADIRPSSDEAAGEKIDDLNVQVYSNVAVVTFRIDVSVTARSIFDTGDVPLPSTLVFRDRAGNEVDRGSFSNVPRVVP